MVNIIPAILSHNMKDFDDKYASVVDLVKRVHIDVIDKNWGERTVFPDEIGELKEGVGLDWHLMVDKPLRWLDKSMEVGSGTVLAQVERMDDAAGFVATAQSMGFRVGLGLDIETEVAAIEPYIWDLDAVLLMSVKAGKSGQVFDKRVLTKIVELREMRRDIRLVIDGGLNRESILECLAADWYEEDKEGVDHDGFMGMDFAVASEIFNSGDIKAKIKQLELLEDEQ
jgi:ribulose-phosphate 3-epimerase